VKVRTTFSNNSARTELPLFVANIEDKAIGALTSQFRLDTIRPWLKIKIDLQRSLHLGSFQAILEVVSGVWRSPCLAVDNAANFSSIRELH